MSFQDNLKKYRDRLGITAKDFAARIDIKYTTYLAYENDGREPKYDTLIKIASALHVSLDDLLGFHLADTLKNITICRNMGLIIEVDEEDGEISNITIFHKNKERIGQMSPELFNLFVPHALENTARSANQFFRLFTQMAVMQFERLEDTSKRNNIYIPPQAYLELIKLLNDKRLNGLLGPMVFEEIQQKRDNVIIEYLKKHYPQAIEKAPQP